MLKVLSGGDVMAVALELHIWVDILESLHPPSHVLSGYNFLQRNGRTSVNYAKTLMHRAEKGGTGFLA